MENDGKFVCFCRQGYSSLAVALALPESGRLVACERDSNSLEVAQRYYELAGVSHKVILCLASWKPFVPRG